MWKCKKISPKFIKKNCQKSLHKLKKSKQTPNKALQWNYTALFESSALWVKKKKKWMELCKKHLVVESHSGDLWPLPLSTTLFSPLSCLWPYASIKEKERCCWAHFQRGHVVYALGGGGEEDTSGSLVIRHFTPPSSNQHLWCPACGITLPSTKSTLHHHL